MIYLKSLLNQSANSYENTDPISLTHTLNYGTYYCGLYIELKRDDVQLIRSKDATKITKDDYKLRKKGDWYDLHTEEQANMLGALRKEGYCAEFAVGFNEAVKLIDNYVKR